MPSIVGTWKLLHATARDAAGAARPSPYGGMALGRVTFTAGGRMMSVVCDGRPELPAGVSREYSSYCGNYTYDGAKLVTRVDAASDLSWIGSDQVRSVRFEGERMVPNPSAAPDRRKRRTPRDHLGAHRGGIEFVYARQEERPGDGASSGAAPACLSGLDLRPRPQATCR
jgi:lipocalin-like protein